MDHSGLEICLTDRCRIFFWVTVVQALLSDHFLQEKRGQFLALPLLTCASLLLQTFVLFVKSREINSNDGIMEPEQ